MLTRMAVTPTLPHGERSHIRCRTGVRRGGRGASVEPAAFPCVGSEWRSHLGNVGAGTFFPLWAGAARPHLSASLRGWGCVQSLAWEPRFLVGGSSSLRPRFPPAAGGPPSCQDQTPQGQPGRAAPPPRSPVLPVSGSAPQPAVADPRAPAAASRLSRAVAMVTAPHPVPGLPVPGSRQPRWESSCGIPCGGKTGRKQSWA